MKVLGAFLIFISIFMFVGLGGYDYYISYQYDKTIGSHIDNAFEVNTPERMIDEIELAKQGMRSTGLTEQHYGAMFFTKPSNSMAFQYEYLDSVIERAHAVEEWNAKVKTDVKATESLGDVYETKMDNLRQFLNENGRADWIAEDAWYVENHPVLYLFEAVGWWGLFIILLLGFGLVSD